ncbi:hypothetical protein PDESU_06067 [Pontiella desulfatans]|uniref:Uncharacterized protein n=1 Tax=Pontiella desulfatans TaxID=2750659 RepID=A0A6C2UDH6_PONDE|nr:hypothetical protein [Pontiella desulfatans]VGO17471.1 hypothetical protein PDESU_06067 [Pontiella desulfatans]
MGKRCFVISPIGMENTTVREHADNVFDLIIAPAAEECGVVVSRSDQMPDPGHIMDQMFRSISKADFCIAILTGHNPNVFYELALCHAACKPVIVLMEKGNELPFDVRDLRCVFYDFGLKATFNRTYAKELQRQIEALRSSNWESSGLFARFVEELNGRVSVEKDGPVEADMLKRILLEATSHVDLMGVSLEQWRDVGGGERLVAKAKEGCKVRIMHMDPAHIALPELVEQASPDRGLEETTVSISMMANLFDKIGREHENIEVRPIHSGVPSVNLLRTDKAALAVTFLHATPPRQSPMWREAPSGSRLYQALTEEFQAMWERNQKPKG